MRAAFRFSRPLQGRGRVTFGNVTPHVTFAECNQGCTVDTYVAVNLSLWHYAYVWSGRWVVTPHRVLHKKNQYFFLVCGFRNLYHHTSKYITGIFLFQCIIQHLEGAGVEKENDYIKLWLNFSRIGGVTTK